VAGTGTSGHVDGPGTSAQFDSPAGVAIDGAGVIVVMDTFNHCVRRIEPTADHAVSTVAGGGGNGLRDGAAGSAQFSSPSGCAIGPDGALVVADTSNDRLRVVTDLGLVPPYQGATTAHPEPAPFRFVTPRFRTARTAPLMLTAVLRAPACRGVDRPAAPGAGSNATGGRDVCDHGDAVRPPDRHDCRGCE
jgi:hypothetical protein